MCEEERGERKREGASTGLKCMLGDSGREGVEGVTAMRGWEGALGKNPPQRFSNDLHAELN